MLAAFRTLRTAFPTLRSTVNNSPNAQPMSRFSKPLRAAAVLACLAAMGGGSCPTSGGTGTPAARNLNENCDSANTCGTLDGTALSCVAGTCQRADCLSGVQGCPCAPANACAVSTNQCVGGTCVDPGCMAGTRGCPCDNGACQGGLMCAANVCRAGGELTLITSTPDARGCDVVLTDPQNAILSVRFAASVEGTWLRRNARVATSFVRKTNEAFPSNAVVVETAQGANLDLVTLASGTCVGLDGRALPAATVNLTR